MAAEVGVAAWNLGAKTALGDELGFLVEPVLRGGPAYGMEGNIFFPEEFEQEGLEPVAKGAHRKGIAEDQSYGTALKVAREHVGMRRDTTWRSEHAKSEAEHDQRKGSAESEEREQNKGGRMGSHAAVIGWRRGSALHPPPG
jgi:hypothetical protein